MTALQEYDMEIKPAKIIKGQGLFQLTAQSNDPENQQTDWEQEEATPTGFVNALETTASEWYDHTNFFLHNGFAPKTLYPKKCRALRMKSAPYQLINDVLFRNNYDGVFLRCLEKDHPDDFLFQFHARTTDGHFSCDTTAHKIIKVGYYWPTLFRDSHSFVKKCEPYRSVLEKLRNLLTPCSQ